MKYSLVLSALTALVAAADKPSFLNSNFQVVEGQPFTFKFNNCDGGCTILLQNGPSTNLKDVKTVTTTTSDGTFTWTPEGVASGTYAFRIINNANREFNFSPQFTYVGTGATTAASGASTAVTAVTSTGIATSSSTGASSIVTSAASQTESTTESNRTATATNSTSSVVTSSANTTISSLSTTMAPSSTTSQSSTSTRSTRSTTSATTTVPNAGGVRATPMAFVAGAIAALAYLG